MLTHLHIQGLAIIDALSIEFSDGFNVITGETGAGKSILIKALGLLLGAKASAETVRRGREFGSVTGTFEVPHQHRCVQVLDEYAIPKEKSGNYFSIIVRRMVTAKGRSQAWINDLPVTSSVLKELAATLIDIFGQNENQRLLDPTQHINYVDLFLSDKELLTNFQHQYRECYQKLRELTDMVDEFRAKRRDADYLAYRCDELRKFAPMKEDFERVQNLCRTAGNLLAIASTLEQAQAHLDQGAGGDSLSRPLWDVVKLLLKLEGVSSELKTLAEDAATAAGRLDELSYQLGRVSSSLEIDESDLEEAQQRYAGYQELFRKLAVADIEQLVMESERLEAELGFLSTASEAVIGRLQELNERTVSLKQVASKLSGARKKAKSIAKNRIERELHELAMGGAIIDIDLSKFNRAIPAADVNLFGKEAAAAWVEIAEVLSSMNEFGAERAQFLLASNPGEMALPLHKVASGGEVSRIMLALKKALAAGADTCILVFDEIDTGISGRVADVVGRKMKELSSSFQVICISHLAQVAAYADSHFMVHKFGKEERTESTITRLGRKESEEEIARLLSGDEVTPSSLANAKNLVKKAKTHEKPIKI